MRICVITAGHLSTSPRMLKAADALTEAGHDVRLVSTRHVDWAVEPDAAICRARPWRWSVVDYSAASGGRVRIPSAVRQRAARAAVAVAGASRVPYATAVRAYSRVHDELVAVALAEPAELFYGGTTGALAATAEAATAAGVPFGVDLEDFHRGEHAEPEGRILNRLAVRVEQRVLPAARCITAASTAIADEYARCCAVTPVTVNNTFPLPPRPPDFDSTAADALRLYWFSQTIGCGRGLEEAIEGIGLSGVPATLTLRGRLVPGYDDHLVSLAGSVAPRLTLSFVAPAAPDAMVDLCAGYDIGLAVEQPVSRNRQLCLSNKAFTYLLAGLAVVMTDTSGQRPLADDIGLAALLYAPGRPQQLADGLRRWAFDREALRAAKRAAWDAARRRWHWEHPAERGALVAAVESAVR